MASHAKVAVSPFNSLKKAAVVAIRAAAMIGTSLGDRAARLEPAGKAPINR